MCKGVRFATMRRTSFVTVLLAFAFAPNRTNATYSIVATDAATVGARTQEFRPIPRRCTSWTKLATTWYFSTLPTLPR